MMNPTVQPSPVHILIVEDELIAAENMARNLRKQGYRVVAIVDSGEDAIQEATQSYPDLVLMDIMLAGDIDGVEAAKSIRTQLQIPVVYMTAYADEVTLERAKQTEPYGYLVKPFKPNDIRTTIEIALQKYRGDRNVRKSLAQARELNQLKAKVLAMASHDLRTPLAIINCSAELLQHYSHKYTDDKKSEHLQRIQTSVRHMKEILEDVLILGQSDTGKLAFQPQPLDVKQFCQQLVDEFQVDPDCPSRVVLVCPTDENPPALIDPKQLRHILMNLLSNALKYSPKDSRVKFTLTFEVDRAIFQIQDRGIGIPPEDLENLFEMFHRAKNVGEIDGTGLGLAIVKHAVELHGGEVRVCSQVGRGTTFTVFLPLTPHQTDLDIAERPTATQSHRQVKLRA